MNYNQIYNDLISTRKSLNRIKEPKFELHHIRMLSLGGKNNLMNEILLTFKEHYIAHLLLDKMYHNYQTEEALAVFKDTALFMCDTKFINSSRFISEKRNQFYEYLKRIGDINFANYIKTDFIKKPRAIETRPRVRTPRKKCKETPIDEFCIKIHKPKRKDI